MLIAIEGIDGSGKGTQAARLHDYVVTAGFRTELISFPRYSQTHFGRTVGRFLNGEFGRLNDVDPHLAATLYAADRFESRELILDLLRNRDVVISDRYVPSNIAHQGAKRVGTQRAELQNWIETVEYEVFQLPRADLTIHLDVPAETAQELIARKSKRAYTDKSADLQEADLDYLKSVRDAYLSMAATNANWHVVSLMDGSRLRSIEEVSGLIQAAVKPVLERIRSPK